MFRDIIRDDNFFRKLLVYWCDEEHLAVVPQLTDHGLSCALLNSDHPSFSAPAGFTQGDLDFHFVAVHRRSGQRRWNKDVAVDPVYLLLENDKPIPIPVQHDRAFNEISCRRFIAVSTVPGQLSVFNEFVEDVFDLLARSGRRVEVFQNPGQIHAAIGRSLNMPKQVFLAKVQGLRVLSGLRFRSRPPHSHNPSLLTSPCEEHRFESFEPKWRNWQTR